MIISRRGLLGMFAAGAAAAIVRTPGLLMPIKSFDGITLQDYVRRVLNPALMQHLDELEQSFMFGMNPRHGDSITIGNTKRVFFDLRRIADRNVLPNSALVLSQ